MCHNQDCPLTLTTLQCTDSVKKGKHWPLNKSGVQQNGLLSTFLATEMTSGLNNWP